MKNWLFSIYRWISGKCLSFCKLCKMHFLVIGGRLLARIKFRGQIFYLRSLLFYQRCVLFKQSLQMRYLRFRVWLFGLLHGGDL